MDVSGPPEGGGIEEEARPEARPEARLDKGGAEEVEPPERDADTLSSFISYPQDMLFPELLGNEAGSASTIRWALVREEAPVANLDSDAGREDSSSTSPRRSQRQESNLTSEEDDIFPNVSPLRSPTTSGAKQLIDEYNEVQGWDWKWNTR